jgi:hypothetical protein
MNLRQWLNPVPELPAWKLYLRLFWVAIQLIFAWCLAQPNNPFFYQGF